MLGAFTGLQRSEDVKRCTLSAKARQLEELLDIVEQREGEPKTDDVYHFIRIALESILEDMFTKAGNSREYFPGQTKGRVLASMPAFPVKFKLDKVCIDNPNEIPLHQHITRENTFENLVSYARDVTRRVPHMTLAGLFTNTGRYDITADVNIGAPDGTLIDGIWT